MRAIATSVLVLLLIAVSAVAQHPDCATLPNGGKLEIKVPGTATRPGCQVCAGPGIPSNPIFGFSDDSRATCELKNLDGGNSGICRKDSTCPPLFSRVQKNGVWQCQAQETTTIIDCKAATKPPAGPTPDEVRKKAIAACVDGLKRMQADLNRVSADFKKTAATWAPATSGTSNAVSSTATDFGTLVTEFEKLLEAIVKTTAEEQLTTHDKHLAIVRSELIRLRLRKNEIVRQLRALTDGGSTAVPVTGTTNYEAAATVAKAKSELEKAARMADECTAKIEAMLAGR